MNDLPFLLQVAVILVPVGIWYGQTNQRIKEAEKQIESLDGLNERMARIEEKIDYIFKHIKN